MLDCVSHRACEEAADEKGAEPHVHAAPVHVAPPGLASAASPIAVQHGASSGSSSSSSSASAFHLSGSASGRVLNLRSLGVARVVGADVYKSGVYMNETGAGPEHTCGSDVAYAYFVSFIFLCSFLVRLPAATQSHLCALVVLLVTTRMNRSSTRMAVISLPKIFPTSR